MHLLRRRHSDSKVHVNRKSGDQEVMHQKCTHCGRQLYERKGMLRRLKPISNAFVVHGNCLACSSESEHDSEHNDTAGITKDEEKVEEVETEVRRGDSFDRF